MQREPLVFEVEADSLWEAVARAVIQIETKWESWNPVLTVLVGGKLYARTLAEFREWQSGTDDKDEAARMKVTQILGHVVGKTH